MRQVVAFSGGKDSTALALRMHELGEEFELLFTPTGNELPGVWDHVNAVKAYTHADLILPKAPTLQELIEQFKALPNWRQRWCTRMIKIQPAIAWFKTHTGRQLCVGLRADEKARQGLYSDLVDVRFPLREWGWGLDDVVSYVRDMGFAPPPRTDCAVCPYQRIGDWYRLWRDHPDHYEQGMEWEDLTGHTFRSPSRDTWPAGMRGLRAEFARGRRPRGVREDEDEGEDEACRVCRM